MRAPSAPCRLLYPVHEAAEQLGIQRTSLYELLKGGELERVKIGRRTLITAESLTEYVDRLRAVADERRCPSPPIIQARSRREA
jgi:excisionase family DNA binding protein